jgi:hypothetical protein
MVKRRDEKNRAMCRQCPYTTRDLYCSPQAVAQGGAFGVVSCNNHLRWFLDFHSPQALVALVCAAVSKHCRRSQGYTHSLEVRRAPLHHVYSCCIMCTQACAGHDHMVRTSLLTRPKHAEGYITIRFECDHGCANAQVAPGFSNCRNLMRHKLVHIVVGCSVANHKSTSVGCYSYWY